VALELVALKPLTFSASTATQQADGALRGVNDSPD